MPGQFAGAVVVPAVEVRLTAAGLRLREIDLDAQAAQQPHRRHPHVGEEDVALAGRPIPPVSLRSQSAKRLAHLRARYEQALLLVLRTKGHVSTSAVAGAVNAALDDLDACLVELAGPDPYDFWRLALACTRTMRANSHSTSSSTCGRIAFMD